MRFLLAIFLLIASCYLTAKGFEEFAFREALAEGDTHSLTGRGTAKCSLFSSPLWREYYNAELRGAPEWRKIVYLRSSASIGTAWLVAAIGTFTTGAIHFARTFSRYHHRKYPSRYDYEVG